MQYQHYVDKLCYFCAKYKTMADTLIYLELEDYLRDWLINENGNPVVVKKNSAESDILETFLTTPPAEPIKDLPAENKVAIRLPSFKYKDTRTHNYLPVRARLALAHAIKVRFRVQMWEELYTFNNVEGCITDIIYAWMEKHGIDLTEKNWETIRQMYFRKRKVYRTKKIEKKPK